MRGKPPPPDEISETLLGELFSTLSPAECRVLRWLAEGKQDEAIARILGLALRTVTTHVSRILGKLGVESRAAAVAEVWRAVIRRIRETLR